MSPKYGFLISFSFESQNAPSLLLAMGQYSTYSEPEASLDSLTSFVIALLSDENVLRWSFRSALDEIAFAASITCLPSDTLARDFSSSPAAFLASPALDATKASFRWI